MAVVIGLNARNIPTQHSCAGHPDRKWTYPYVDIYADNKIDFEDYSTENIQRKEKWIKKNIELQKKAISLLTEFYKSKKSAYTYQITLHTIIDLGSFRLKSMGADLLQLLPKTKRKQELKKYQNEMKRFGQFLLDKYHKRNLHNN